MLILHDDVVNALNNGQPIVALESTIISHGMPYPQNFETAISVENICRDCNVIPATIAILDGVIRVGLTRDELDRLARLGTKCRKVSRRDLAMVVSQRLNGATTVAATMFIANLAGIKVFVTGGIGGVHRGATDTMDISADLVELGRTPVAVVCAGVKSILDIPKTLEVLETNGVSVITVGSDEFPAFFTRHSGCKSPAKLSTAQQCAALIKGNADMSLASGMLFAVPVPEKEAAESTEVTVAIERALKEVDSKKLEGHEVTPFLLKRVNELTHGRSLVSNIALVKNNCRVGCAIAIEYARLCRSEILPSSVSPKRGDQHVVVIGATNRDMIGKPHNQLLMRTSNPGAIKKTWGGVGRNIAECLCRLGQQTTLVTALGRDPQGEAFKFDARMWGMNVVMIPSVHATSIFMGILDKDGDLFTTIADMDAVDDVTPDAVPDSVFDNCAMVVLDANLSEHAIHGIAQRARQRRVPVWFEATALVKVRRAMVALEDHLITHLSCNVDELLNIVNDERTSATSGQASMNTSAADYMQRAKASEGLDKGEIEPVITRLMSTFDVQMVVVSRGANGVVSMWKDDQGRIHKADAAAIPTRVVNTTGAGDSMVGGIIWSLLGAAHGDVPRALAVGQLCASLSLQTHSSVSHLITPDVTTQVKAKL